MGCGLMARLITEAVDEEASLLASKLTETIQAVEALVDAIEALGVILAAIQAKLNPMSYTANKQLKVTGGIL